jgi:hypothetical protein
VGERGAVRPKSGKSVRQSDPGLRRPTPPPTAGRKPAARPPLSFPPLHSTDPAQRECPFLPAQPKTGRGAGQSPAVQAARSAVIQSLPTPAYVAPVQLENSEIGLLVEFFKILDRWDREHGCSDLHHAAVTRGVR